MTPTHPRVTRKFQGNMRDRRMLFKMLVVCHYSRLVGCFEDVMKQQERRRITGRKTNWKKKKKRPPRFGGCFSRPLFTIELEILKVILGPTKWGYNQIPCVIFVRYLASKWCFAIGGVDVCVTCFREPLLGPPSHRVRNPPPAIKNKFPKP